MAGQSQAAVFIIFFFIFFLWRVWQTLVPIGLFLLGVGGFESLQRAGSGPTRAVPGQARQCTEAAGPASRPAFIKACQALSSRSYIVPPLIARMSFAGACKDQLPGFDS